MIVLSQSIPEEKLMLDIGSGILPALSCAQTQISTVNPASRALLASKFGLHSYSKEAHVHVILENKRSSMK